MLILPAIDLRGGQCVRLRQGDYAQAGAYFVTICTQDRRCLFGDIANDQMRLRLDSGRTVALNLRAHPHLDHGYAVTSHSSQGQTADRVLVHIDLERSGEQLVNRRLAYVAVSRGRYDAQIYTNDKARLSETLDRDISHRSAIETTRVQESPAQTIERSPARQHSIGFGI